MIDRRIDRRCFQCQGKEEEEEEEEEDNNINNVYDSIYIRMYVCLSVFKIRNDVTHSHSASTPRGSLRQSPSSPATPKRSRRTLGARSESPGSMRAPTLHPPRNQALDQADNQTTDRIPPTALTIHCEQRLSLPCHHWVVRIERLHQVQLAVLFDQPQPPRSEERAWRTHGLELFRKRLVRSKRLVDHVSQLASGEAAARGLDGFPEKVVVVDLPSADRPIHSFMAWPPRPPPPPPALPAPRC